MRRANAAVVSVGVTPTQLTADPAGRPALSLLVYVPVGGTTVFVGAAGVTTAAGFPVAADRTLSVDFPAGGELWGIVAAGSQEVNVLEVSV